MKGKSVFVFLVVESYMGRKLVRDSSVGFLGNFVLIIGIIIICSYQELQKIHRLKEEIHTTIV